MSTTTRPTSPSAAFWAALVVGSAIASWGILLFLEAVPDAGRRWPLVLWIVGADLAHDLILAPMVGAIGWLSTRVSPKWVRAPVQVGLLMTATVLLVGWLPLIGSADAAGNDTIQPLDYRTAVATVLGLVWGSVAVWTLVAWGAHRRSDR
jgi:hypothetical protein